MAWWEAKWSRLLATSLAVVAGAILLTPPTFGVDGDMENALVARAKYGLTTDPATVSKLLTTGASPESEVLGFPVTRAEARDLDERSAFVQHLGEKTLPYVENLEDYAGHWIDQKNGGRLVVMLTNPTASVKDRVRARMPSPSRGVRFEKAAHDMKSLQRVFRDIETKWPREGIAPIAFAIDERRNLIVAKVPREQMAKAEAATIAIGGVDIAFEQSSPIEDTAIWSQCVGRGNCYGPFQLGVRVFYSSPGASWRCGMGFNVRHSSNSNLDKAFLTAGHCGYQRNGWWRHSQDYQDAYGAVGKKKASPYDSGDGRDVMVVAISDWAQNKTSRIKGETASSVLIAAQKPSQGQQLYLSLAQSAVRYHGSADARSQKWKSTYSGEWMHGSGLDFDNANWSLDYGDSGSPIYVRNCTASPCEMTPVGLVSAGTEVNNTSTYNHDVYFTKVWWVVNTKWSNMYIYKGADGVGGPP